MPTVGRLSSHSPNVQNWAIGGWCLMLLGAYLVLLYATYRSHGNPRWEPVSGKEAAPADPAANNESSPQEKEPRSLTRLGLYFALGSLVVLVAGWIVAMTSDALAEQTGLGGTFVGFTLLALSTSLPEISTTVAASRAGRYDTAFSNVFGSNAFDTTLLVLVALLAGGPALIASLSPSVLFAAALGILLTCIYLWGLLERDDRSLWRFGWDSAAVIALVLVGNLAVFWLK
jgi:cation:H+ antiporter